MSSINNEGVTMSGSSRGKFGGRKVPLGSIELLWVSWRGLMPFAVFWPLPDPEPVKINNLSVHSRGKIREWRRGNNHFDV